MGLHKRLPQTFSMFVVEKARQIMAFVSAVTDSIAAIATGNLTDAATKVEKALASGIPVAIGFLASLLGLGGITTKIKEIITNVRTAVDNAINAVFNSGPVQKVAGFIRGIVDKIKGGINKIKNFLFPQKQFAIGEESHTLSIQEEAGEPTVYMASDSPSSLIKRLNAAQSNKDISKENKELIPSAKAIAVEISGLAKKAKSEPQNQESIKSQIDAKYVELTPLVAKIFEGLMNYRSPEVGTHKSLLAKAKSEPPLPDKTTRQSHHVPAVELAETINLAIGDTLDQFPAAKDAGKLNSIKLSIANKIVGHGDGLSAILIHEKTHKINGGSGPKIHGSEIRGELEKQMISKGYKLSQLISTKNGKRIAVNPQSDNYKEFLNKIGVEVTGQQPPALSESQEVRISDEIKKAMADSATDALKIIYNRESDRTIEAVRIAVSASTVDGGPERNDKVNELHTVADGIWKTMLEI